MRKKRLFALLLMIGLSALFVTLQINSAGIVSAQNAKAPQDGFIGGCSVIDPLDECIQQRFSKADTIFGYARVATPTNLERGHRRFFQAETEKERAVKADMERSGLQVGFYLCGGDPHYRTAKESPFLPGRG